MAVEPRPCAWFALCDREAVTTRGHPILGAVPIRARCNGSLRAVEGRGWCSSRATRMNRITGGDPR